MKPSTLSIDSSCYLGTFLILANNDSFLFLTFQYVCFISFSYLIALSRTHQRFLDRGDMRLGLCFGVITPICRAEGRGQNRVGKMERRNSRKERRRWLCPWLETSQLPRQLRRAGSLDCRCACAPPLSPSLLCRPGTLLHGPVCV